MLYEKHCDISLTTCITLHASHYIHHATYITLYTSRYIPTHAVLDNPANEPFPDDVEYDREEEDKCEEDEDLVSDVSSVELGDEAPTHLDARTYLLHPRLGLLDLT